MTPVWAEGLPEPPRSLRVELRDESATVTVPGNPKARLVVMGAVAASAAAWPMAFDSGAWLTALAWSMLPLALGAFFVPPTRSAELVVSARGGTYRQRIWRGTSEIRFEWTQVEAVVVSPSAPGLSETDPDDPGHVEIRFVPRTLSGPLWIATGRPAVELAWIGVLLEAARGAPRRPS